VTTRWRQDRGAGLLSTAAGVVVFLVFLLFAVQLLFGLYASSTVTAVANDAATRAASAHAPSLAVIEAEARASLGEIGEEASFTWALDDSDGDGVDDTVVLEVVASPPRFIPSSIGGSIGLDEVRRLVRIRTEREQ
jgi:Flp pilus assembly protein TadG